MKIFYQNAFDWSKPSVFKKRYAYFALCEPQIICFNENICFLALLK